MREDKESERLNNISIESEMKEKNRKREEQENQKKKKEIKREKISGKKRIENCNHN